MFLEAPSARPDDGALVVKVELPSGRTASVLSRADVLLDRLDELQGTGHLVVGQQVLALLGGMPMRTLATDITAGRREPPESDELHEIARAALRAEYAPRSP